MLPQQRGQRPLLLAGPDTLVPGKNLFSRADGWDNPGQQEMGRFLVQKELLPTPILTAAQGGGAKEHLPAWRGDCGWERSRAAPGQTIPCPERDTRDSHVSLTASSGMGPSLLPFPAAIPCVHQPLAEDGLATELALLPGQLVPSPWGITRVKQFQQL